MTQHIRAHHKDKKENEPTGIEYYSPYETSQCQQEANTLRSKERIWDFHDVPAEVPYSSVRIIGRDMMQAYMYITQHTQVIAW